MSRQERREAERLFRSLRGPGLLVEGVCDDPACPCFGGPAYFWIEDPPPWAFELEAFKRSIRKAEEAAPARATSSDEATLSEAQRHDLP
jgi:hypothetical protein